MTERCLDTFPEDWVNPRIVRLEDYDRKEYADGVKVIIEEPFFMDGYLVNPASIETRYPDRALHYDNGYDEDGNFTGRPIYIPNGIPE